jgi:hypothetical protein
VVEGNRKGHLLLGKNADILGVVLGSKFPSAAGDKDRGN